MLDVLGIFMLYSPLEANKNKSTIDLTLSEIEMSSFKQGVKVNLLILSSKG